MDRRQRTDREALRAASASTDPAGAAFRATLRGADFCQALADDMTSPQALAVGLLMIALIVVLVRTDWTRVLKR